MSKKVSKSLSLVLVLTMVFTSLFSFGMPNIANATYATDLFISQYIEGSGSNKVIEIFNGTPDEVNLDEYKLELYSNGASSSTASMILSGTLASGEVYVLANSGAIEEILAIADTTNNSVINFNGDDAVVLKHNDVVIDVFGTVGKDPGKHWGSGEYTTSDHNLIRKSSITSGYTDSSVDFDPSLEWDSYAKDTYNDLGTHTMDGFGDGGSGTDPDEQVANVTALPASGAVEEGTEVTLSTSTEGATVYYAVYTEEITDADYEIYDDNEPIVVNEPLTIKAFAAKEGLKDSDVKEFEYSIKEPATLISIEEARTKANEEVMIKGIVIWVDGQKVYMQDETAGIAADYYGIKEFMPDIKEGDLIEVQGKIGTFNSLVTLNVYKDKTEVISSDNVLPEPKVITISQVNEGKYEAQLVKIDNVTLGAINNNSNTVITDSTGQTNVYRIPSLENISEGDTVNIIAIVSRYSKTGDGGYQLRVRKAEDVEKIVTPDTQQPVITHTPVTKGNVDEDLMITATVTDDRQVESVKLYYRTKGTQNYTIVDMTKTEDSYIYAIPKTDLAVAGIEYYIEVSDGTNTATSPEDVSTPYQVTISEDDITPPQIMNITPASGSSTGAELKPVISAEYSDTSGIDTASIKLYLDGTEVTENATITETKITYTPLTDLAKGNHTVKLEVSDKAATPQTAILEWNFYVGEKEYNFYFGQLHSHTNISDGQGSLDDAYSWARDKGNADFFAVTDHSNWFDNEKDTSNETITDISQSTSNEWKLMHSIADSYNKDGEFVAIAGFEMTWSGSTGGWGHINTFNTPWFASRSNSNMDLPAYYSHISKDTDSISQLNHPGKTFGDFADFGYYSEAVDNVVHLVEVGNGEGPVRGSGYFPSYEYYTRALDKGWHVAPSNNQDNHKGNWITSNEARTVVLAQNLTRDNIFDAIRNLRVYSTEDSNLEIMYTVNNEIMGSSLDEPDMLDISIEVNDPDESDIIEKISIISNGGEVVESKTFNDNTAVWNLQIDPQYNYYYVRVEQEDKDIAVTAPVWTSEVEAIGISKVDVSQDPVIVGEEFELSAEVYNNSQNPITNIIVEFYENEVSEANKISEATITEIETGKTGIAKIDWTPTKVGTYTIYAKATLNVDGTDKIYTQSRKVLAGNEEDFVRVLVDGGHSNQYVTGNYAGKIETLKEMMKERNYILNINMDELTTEDLKGVSLLIITDPQGTDNPKYNEVKSNYTAEEITVIKDFVESGGSIIVTSRADYKDGIEEYSNSAQLNPILEAIGTNLRVNDDEVIDETSNGGQKYRLYFDQYISSKYDLTKDIPEGITYSFYSGCSVILKDGGNDEKVDWLVKGHETTETMDADNVGDNISVDKGNVYVLAAEELANGAKVIVAGTTFFSDFETASSDNQYSNKQITENILDWIIQPEEAELKTIAEVRADEDKDGKPDLFGQRFTIEGRVTAQSEAVTPKNAFFEVIYVQDETGGITVFGISATPLPLGTKVRVTGIVDQYDGDTEISVENESKDLVVLDDKIVLVEPKVMSTGDSMLEENEGWLVKIQGTVTRITENSLYIDDGTGEARIYVNGYIGDGTGNPDTLGKWDPTIKVGDKVSAIGLASEDPEGHRLRVRNTAEIVKIEEIDYPINIQTVKTSDINGNLTEEFELGNMVMVNAVITNSVDEDVNCTFIVKLVDSEGRTYAIGFMNGVELEVNGLRTLSMGFNVNGVSAGTHTAKVYVWDNFTDKAPLSEVGTVEFTVK